MKETNDYGMYSGGYIFDQMDRAALMFVRYWAKLPDDAVLVTKRVHNLEFKRQLCDKYNVTVRCDHYHELKLYSVLYSCYAEVLDNTGKVVASGNFTFTLATNHCELKGEKNDNVVAGTVSNQVGDMGVED